MEESMNEQPREDDGPPLGALHEELKQRRAGRLSADPDTQMGYDAASDADEPGDAAGEPGDAADGTPSFPGGDTEEKLARGSGGVAAPWSSDPPVRRPRRSAEPEHSVGDGKETGGGGDETGVER
jgi:hypothetical protein